MPQTNWVVLNLINFHITSFLSPWIPALSIPLPKLETSVIPDNSAKFSQFYFLNVSCIWLIFPMLTATLKIFLLVVMKKLLIRSPYVRPHLLTCPQFPIRLLNSCQRPFQKPNLIDPCELTIIHIESILRVQEKGRRMGELNSGIPF